LEFRNFENYTNLGFATKLMALRERAEERTSRADEDAAAIAHDRGIFPKPIEDTKGQPMWKGSKAQELLQQDMAANKHKEMKPKELYETREEYYDSYSLDSFRDRIYQEAKFSKRAVWVADKAAKKAAKIAAKHKNKTT